MVTGASSGIGEAVARGVARAGAEVLLVARSEDRLKQLRNELQGDGGRAHVHTADLSDSDSTEELVKDVLDRHGRVDVLVSNAGHSIRRSIALTYDRFHDFERTIAVNYLGPMRLVLGLLPGMRERQRGHIVNVSSLGVLFNAPRFSAYLGSKSALDAALRCVAAEVRGDGVAVTSIYMPLVHTPMVEATRVYRLLPGLTAEQAADRVCSAIVERPAIVVPWSGRLGRLAYDFAPAPFDALLNVQYRLSSDSSAAKGEDSDRLESPVLEGLAQGVRKVKEILR